MKLRAILIALVLASIVRPAEARRINGKFLLDFAPGITVPVADDGWRSYAGPSFKFSLRVGGELWVARRFGIAGEVDFDPEPLMTVDGAKGRFRGLVGL